MTNDICYFRYFCGPTLPALANSRSSLELTALPHLIMVLTPAVENRFCPAYFSVSSVSPRPAAAELMPRTSLLPLRPDTSVFDARSSCETYPSFPLGVLTRIHPPSREST